MVILPSLRMMSRRRKLLETWRTSFGLSLGKHARNTTGEASFRRDMHEVIDAPPFT